MKNLLRAIMSLGLFAGLVYLENRRPLRKETEPKLRRNTRNLTLAGLSAATIHFVETPVVRPVARLVERRRWGLLKQLRLPPLVEMVVAALLMDYTLYLWHILTHRVPLLWRFHAVHHVDLNMDASTALRFHFGEMALSVPYRAAQVLLIGVGPVSFTAWQTFLSLSILFHHSNLNLSEETERRLSRLIVTPRMHGLHHSRDAREANANWSSGVSAWDRLHRTFKLDVVQRQPEIGVRGLESPEQVNLTKLLSMPWEEPREVSDYLKSAKSGSRSSRPSLSR